MDRLNNYIGRVGSLELGTVIFWMFFWLANGLAKLIAGTHIGVKFAARGDVNPFEITWIRWVGAQLSATLPTSSQASLN